MTRPLLSIVVPAYRVEPYLPRCLDSLLSDPSPAVEVVAVDDHSPDSSGAVLDTYAARDPRLHVIHAPVNGGLARARNSGLARARGRYVWFVDGDDWLPAGAVAAVRQRLAATFPDVLVVDHAEVHPDGEWRSVTPPGVLDAGPPRPLAQRPQLLALAHSACTKVIRRTFLDTIGLRFRGGWYEDGPFSHTLLISAGRIDTLDRVCYCYRQRTSEAITKSVSSRHFEVFGQYARLWADVDAVAPAYDRFRPDLFRLMIDHYLVIAGNSNRLPSSLRREFFARMVTDYRRHAPPGGYPPPRGLAGIKHRLVRDDSYRIYAALRLAWRAAAPQRRQASGDRFTGTAAPPGNSRSDMATGRRPDRPDRDGSRSTAPSAGPAPAAAPAGRSDSRTG
jgi:glycosyltransferase involved in cell wall biosynthesis